IFFFKKATLIDFFLYLIYNVCVIFSKKCNIIYNTFLRSCNIMKIGIFTDTYNPVTSGVVTSINMLEQEMKKRGHEVFVFTTSKSIQPNDNQTLYMLNSIPLLIAKQYKNRIATFYSREIAKQIKE